MVAAALCFSTTGTSRALADVDASPLAVGAARVLVGGTLIALIGLVTRASKPRVLAGGTPGKRPWLPVAIGAAGVLAYQPFFFLGTQLNGVAVGTVVTLGAAPLVTGLVTAVAQRRTPGRAWLWATLMALIGLVLVSGVADPGLLRAVDPVGLLSSVAAGTSYASYILASKQLLDRGWAPTRAMGAIFGSAAAASLPLLLIAGTSWLATPSGITLAAWLGVVTVAVAYLLFAWGLGRLAATTAATLSLAEPLSATMLGLLILGERLSPLAIGGIVLISLALLLLAVLPSTDRPAVSGTA